MKIKLAPSHWSLFASIVAHTAILWFFMRVPIYPPVSPFPVNVRLAEQFTDGRDATPSENSKGRMDLTATRGAARKPEASRHQSTAPQSNEQNSGGGYSGVGSDATSTGSGNIATDPEGISIGGGLSRDSGVGPLGEGPPSGVASGEASPNQVKSAPARGRDQVPPVSAVTVTESIRRAATPFGAEIYFEIDMYLLYNSNIQVGIKIPGNEICLEGDQLRTIQPVTFRETKTDFSKCRSRTRGDDEKWFCPPHAHAVLTTSLFLSSPVTFSLNRCLVYDKSSCRWRERNGNSIEVCRAKPDYQGIWAPGTQLHYPCAESQMEVFSHSLEYGVRFMQDIENRERHLRRKVIHSERRSIPACTENVLKSYPATNQRTRFVFLSEWMPKRPAW